MYNYNLRNHYMKGLYINEKQQMEIVFVSDIDFYNFVFVDKQKNGSGSRKE